MLAVVAAVTVLAGVFAVAESPAFLSQLSEAVSTGLGAQPADIKDPAGAPMQCAAGCERMVNEERAVCGGYMSDEERVRRKIPVPSENCDFEVHSRYSACLVNCGMPAPPPIKIVGWQSRRARPLPALGSPEELALRRGAP